MENSFAEDKRGDRRMESFHGKALYGIELMDTELNQKELHG